MAHVPLWLPPHPAGTIQVQAPKVPDAWWTLRGATLPDGALTLLDAPYKGARGLRAKKVLPDLLPTGDWLRVPVVSKTLAKRFAKLDGVTLRPVTLADAKGKLGAGYAIVEITARLPLERTRADATWTQGWLDELTTATWTRAPAIFRVLDRPHLIYVDEAVLEPEALDDGGTPELFPPAWSLPRLPALPPGDAAERAFWALSAGDTKQRAAAIAHPWWAFAVAACVDREPRDDTRAATIADPILAARYAVELDRAPREDTRTAARRHGAAAVHYASHLDAALSAEARAAVLATGGHDDDTIVELEAQLAELRAMAGGGPAPARIIVARRAWPAHDRPRYAAAAKGHHVADAALRSDIDAFIERGYGRLGLTAPSPEEVVEAALAHVEGAKALRGKARTTMHMELGCAWGEQLHRALGWQWAKLGDAVALISPDRAHAHFPLAFVQAQTSKRATATTIALLFNMLAAGQLPPSKPRAYTAIG